MEEFTRIFAKVLLSGTVGSDCCFLLCVCICVCEMNRDNFDNQEKTPFVNDPVVGGIQSDTYARWLTHLLRQEFLSTRWSVFKINGFSKEVGLTHFLSLGFLKPLLRHFDLEIIS